MADLTLRSNKGSPLTIAEGDNNLLALNADIDGLKVRMDSTELRLNEVVMGYNPDTGNPIISGGTF